jgi:hypothetical protein
VTRSRLAEILTDEVRDAAFTVQFSKQPTSKRAQDLVDKALKDNTIPEGRGRKRKLKEVADACLGGEKRILRGHLIRKEAFMGRSMVVDLDIENTHNERQVDHRSLDYLIVRGKKYRKK